MRKIFLQECIESSFNAGSKARNDCDEILKRNGFRPCYVKLYGGNRISRYCYSIFNLIKIFFKILLSDVCIIQYPYYRLPGLIFYKLVFGLYHGEIICLIHDILDLRTKRERIEPELRFVLKKSKMVIAHTQKMKELIIREIKMKEDKIKVLYLFDYLSNSSITFSDLSKKEIVFAGNLNKSPFIRNLNDLNGNLLFYLYGAHSPYINEGSKCVYNGKFQPDDLSNIKGSWGLVWDGDKLDTCSGPDGEYLRYNSSHKISLYLASGKPVIIWDQSSLKEYIEKHHLGFSIASLEEIENKINALTTEELTQIQESVAQYSNNLREGAFLSKFLI